MDRLLALLLLLLPTGCQLYHDAHEERAVEMFLSVYREVRADFQDEIDPEILVQNSLRGMLGGLDAHSKYFSADQSSEINSRGDGVYGGLGFRGVLDPSQQELIVLYPLVGSPAEAAGLRCGDRLLAIDGRPMASFGGWDGIRKALTTKHQPLALTVRSGTEATTRTRIASPGPVQSTSIRWARLLGNSGKIGYLHIHEFTAQTTREFDAAVSELLAAGARGLVIDLRFNPGGIQSSCGEIANRFIPRGLLWQEETRHGKRMIHADPGKAHLAGLPLAVLVNQDSASGAELLAAALQDHQAAVIVGTRTYGKDTIQRWTTLRSGESYAITVGHYLSPEGRSVARDRDGQRGLAPDEEVALDTATRARLKLGLRHPEPRPEWRATIRALLSSLGQSDQIGPLLVKDDLQLQKCYLLVTYLLQTREDEHASHEL